MKERDKEEINDILKEIAIFCEECPSHECCPEDECVLYRIEKKVLESVPSTDKNEV